MQVYKGQKKKMEKELITIILCHLIGDYALQQDFIAKTKGSNWYHLFVHCALYCVPFVVVYGIDIRVLVIFASHFVIDAGKARYGVISYKLDQVLHYFFAVAIYLLLKF